MHKRGLCCHAVSVCPSVCLSRSWILSKRINISSKFFHHRVATLCFFSTKRHGNIPTGTSLTWASNSGGVGKNRDSGQMTIDQWLLLDVRTTTATVHRAVQFTAQTTTHQWILFIIITTRMDDPDEEKIREQNIIVRNGKSEADVTNNGRLRSTYILLKLLTDTKHRAASLWQQGYLYTADRRMVVVEGRNVVKGGEIVRMYGIASLCVLRTCVHFAIVYRALP